MSAPRSIYASELPDGRWEIIVGEMGGDQQWRAEVRAEIVGRTAAYYALYFSLASGPSWKLLPATGPLADPAADYEARAREEIAASEAFAAASDDLAALGPDPDPVDIEALLEEHFRSGSVLPHRDPRDEVKP